MRRSALGEADYARDVRYRAARRQEAHTSKRNHQKSSRGGGREKGAAYTAVRNFVQRAGKVRPVVLLS
jgi:hypothetical protein